jgi:hypothetical protein
VRIILIADGDIFTRDEGVCAKTIACLVIVDSVSIVVKDPAGVLLAPGLMSQLTHLFILTVPKTVYPAGFAMRSPECCVDMALGTIAGPHPPRMPLMPAIRPVAIINSAETSPISAPPSKAGIASAIARSNLEFDANFHNLGARNLEIRTRPLRVMMHEREQLLAPARQT